MITTYKYYNEKRQRLAIRAYNIRENKMDILVLTCSRKDDFSKKFARHSFKLIEDFPGKEIHVDGQLIHPQEFTLNFEDGKAAKTFFDWCKKRYLKKIEYCDTYRVTALEGEHIIIKLNAKKNGKW